jgi:PleD family two-component response regulator
VLRHTCFAAIITGGERAVIRPELDETPSALIGDTQMDRNRVLLVDDEQAITDNLAPLLERAGFAVTVAADGDVSGRPRRAGESARH